MGDEILRSTARISRRQALTVGALSVAGWARASRESSVTRPHRPNIIVYLADSLRWDRLSCYGFQRPATPTIDKFSAEACLFERCYSASTWTKPSIASLFTGVPPRIHEAALAGAWNEDNGNIPVHLLRPSFPTLAERLKSAGYQTAWFLANPVVESQYGFARGVDRYRYVQTEPVSDQALAVMQWLRKEAREPFFLFVHAIDPHYPYMAPDEAFHRLYQRSRQDFLNCHPGRDGDFFRSYVQERGNVFNNTELGRTSFRDLSPKGLAILNGLYLAEVAHVDHQFGRILNTLRGKGYLERSVSVFTSDHGEAFGEHGLFYHAHAPYEHQIRTPLVVRLPGPPRPQRVTQTVSLCDLYPTLLHLAGVRPPAFVHAESLFDEQLDVAVRDHHAVHADYDHNSPVTDAWSACMVLGDLKVMRTPHDDGIHAFDLAEDPGELNDLMMAGRGQSGEIQVLIERFLDEWSRDRCLARAFGEPEYIAEEDDSREALRALGYI